MEEAIFINQFAQKSHPINHIL